MNICFLDNNNISYDLNSLNNKNIRGAERVIINLVIKLNKLGHKITVLNKINGKKIFQNIRFINIDNYEENTNYDLAITNNDINNFRFIKSKKNIAISHSIQSIEKFIRKKQILAFLKYKPKILLLSKYHMSKRSFFTRMFGSDIINWAVDDDCIKMKLNKIIDNDKALFASYPDRNLDKLISIWINHINPINKNLKLFVTPTSNDYGKYNIYNREFVDRKNFLNEMLTARVLLIPGHVAELYCLVAEEARELCIPIVTYGIGSLSERVIHNKTGFIARNQRDFADKTIELFNNDSLWNEIRSNLIHMRNSNNWDVATDLFLNKCKF